LKVDFSLVSKHLITNLTPIDTFSCLEPAMEKFITKEALIDQNNQLGKTMCWVLDKKILLGFISLATYSIDKKEMPEDGDQPFRYQTIPSMLIGQFAAHKDYAHNGLGNLMLDYAIRTSYVISMDVGCRLLALQPLNHKAQEWYAKNTSFKLLNRKSGKKPILYLNLLKK
jgi:hypothetical protein